MSPRGPDRVMTCMTKADGHIAPCKAGADCPKESPEKAHEHELSEKNHKTLKIFLKVKNGLSPGPTDPLLDQNLTLVGNIWREFEQHQQTKQSEASLAKMMQMFLGK